MLADFVRSASEGLDAAGGFLTSPHAIVVTLIVSFFTFAGTVATGTLAYLSNRNARQANQAVNHAPEGEDRLWDMVWQIRQAVADNTIHIKSLLAWQESWAKLPASMSSAERVAATVSSLAFRLDLVAHAIDELIPVQSEPTVSDVWVRLERRTQL